MPSMDIILNGQCVRTCYLSYVLIDEYFGVKYWSGIECPHRPTLPSSRSVIQYVHFMLYVHT